MSTTHNLSSKSSKKQTKQYKRPLGLSAWSDYSGCVWISMKPKKIKDQFTKGAGTIVTDEPLVEFYFLAPLSLNEHVVHHWEAYESVSSRLAQKVRSIQKLTNEGLNLWNSANELLNKDAKDIIGNISEKGLNINEWARSLYNSTGGTRIPKQKIDTPLYYANSDRRQLSFSFVLFNETYKDDPNPDKSLLEPIQEMMKYSSPDLVNQGGMDIEFPYMWEVKTKPAEFINYTTCALTAVQPTWNAPYVNGYPISCNLELTFTDLSPLYAGTIERGSVINVKSDISKNVQSASKVPHKTPKVKKPGIVRRFVNNAVVDTKNILR